MFTGIIQNIGTVEKIETKGDWIVFLSASFPLDTLALGASIACDGICLTVVEKTDRCFLVQLSSETVSRTTARWWKTGCLVNLERSLKMGDELGGHIVAGHVDGLAKVVSIEEEKDSLRYRFELPAEFAPFLAPKGSIALDGISLTVNEVDGPVFGVNIIPHTQKETTIGQKKPGDLMNFEIDLIARYVGNMLRNRGLV